MVHLHIGRVVIDRAVAPETAPDAASLQIAIASRLGTGDASARTVSPMQWPVASQAASPIASQDTASTQGTLVDAVAGGVANAVAARLAIVGTQTGGRHG